MGSRTCRVAGVVLFTSLCAFHPASVHAQERYVPEGAESPDAESQGPPNLLEAVRPGQEVDVVTREGRLVRGRLVEVTPAVVILEGRRGPEEIPLHAVREVWSRGRARYLGFTATGALTGLGLGLMALEGQGDCDDPTSLCATDGPTTGSDIASITALGAAVGAGLAWWKRHPRHLLYVGPDDPRLAATVAVGGVAVDALDRPDWAALGGLRGTLVEVSAAGPRSTLEGALVGIGPGSLTLLVEGEPYIVPRAAVEKVWREPRVGWWQAGVATLLCGAVLGGLAAAFACPSEGDAWTSCDDQAFGIATAVAGGLVVIQTVRQRREAIVYDARHPRRRGPGHVAVQPLVGPHAVGVRGAVSF